MGFIDSEGRLFGRVNIVDALVVLFVLAVAGAGTALVVGPSGGQETTTSNLGADYVTVTVGPLPDDVATQLATADTLTIAGTETALNVTDSVRTPHPTQDAAYTIVRVRAPGESTPTQLKRSLTLTAGQFTYNGTVSSLSDDPTIERQTTSTVLRTTVSAQVAGTIAPGDTYRLGNETVATITDVQRVGGQRGQRDLLVALDFSTYRLSGSTWFANRPVTIDSSMPFRTSSYGFIGDVFARGQSDIPMQNETVRATATVSPTVATNVDVGDAYTLDGETIATVQSVNTYPVARSSQQRLSLTMRLRTNSLDGRTQFLGTPVRTGASIPFETSAYRFGATIVNTNGTTPGQPVAATMRVRWENVRPVLADAVESGMSERHRGADTTVTDVRRESATVVLESESGEIFAREHPVNEDVTLTLSTTVQQAAGEFSFHGRPVQTGDSVVLDFGTVTVDGTLVGLSVDE